MDADLRGISDTALMIAAARAKENDNPDGFVSDPWAARLAGQRGVDLLSSTNTSEWMAYGIGLRTLFVDELLLSLIGRGEVDTVLSINPGLDTRPWRLDLAPDFRWVEVDATPVLEYKSQVLAGDRPRCLLEWEVADINDAAARERLIQLASRGSTGVAVLVEGGMMYLPGDTVSLLAQDGAAAGLRAWLFALVSPELRRASHGNQFQRIQDSRAGGCLDGPAVLTALAEAGWSVADRRLTVVDGWKIGQKRIMAMRTPGAVDSGGNSTAAQDDITGAWLCKLKGPAYG